MHLIVNPRARMYRRTPALLERVRRAARGRLTVYVTPDLQALERAVDGLLDDDSDLVLLSGGDGTLMAGVTALAARRGT
jgi:diacylglycerol kinase family enzyme